MTERSLPYLMRQRNRRGEWVWYVRRYGRKLRLRGSPEDSGFLIEYQNVLQKARPLNPHDVATIMLMPSAKSWLARAWRRSKANAALRKIQFSLSLEELEQIFRRSGGACEVTGIAFDLERLNGSTPSERSPWSPTIDRTDSALGYAPENCRFVCRIVNYAMNEWGEDALWALVEQSSRTRAQLAKRKNYPPHIVSTLSGQGV